LCPSRIASGSGGRISRSSAPPARSSSLRMAHDAMGTECNHQRRKESGSDSDGSPEPAPCLVLTFPRALNPNPRDPRVWFAPCRDRRNGLTELEERANLPPVQPPRSRMQSIGVGLRTTRVVPAFYPTTLTLDMVVPEGQAR